MKIYIFLILLISNICYSHTKHRDGQTNDNRIPFDTIPTFVDDTHFKQAYDEIEKMLDGKDSLNFKRASFLVEWAYLDGNLNYKKFCSDIDSVTTILRNFIKARGLNQYKTAGNFALFEYFTKSNALNGEKPFKYDFEDFTGAEDFRKTFVTKLMETHTGQCRSLPIYYKILSEELRAESFLALAPYHIYIKHIDEYDRWVNIELTNGHFSTDAWMISTMNISAESIKNRVYLDALNMKESIALLLTDLALGYQKKYGQTPSPFIEQNYKAYNETRKQIENFGFRETTRENYEEWVRVMENEKDSISNSTN